PTGLTGRSLPHDRLFAALEAVRAAGHSPWILLPERLRIQLRPLHSLLWEPKLDGPSVVDELIATTASDRIEEITTALEAAVGRGGGEDGARVLEPDELRRLSDQGWEIGSHTVGHVALIHETSDRVRRELSESKAAIESWTQRPCRYFAYCNGLHD